MNTNTIGAFAKLGGVGVETIRFYQRQGILPIPAFKEELGSRKIRYYGDEDLYRLRFILAAKKAGFTLKEIKKLLDLDAKNDRNQVRDIAQKRIEKLDAQLSEIIEARDSLSRLVKECKKVNSKPCPILTAFERK